jgi:hypothetical protein
MSAVQKWAPIPRFNGYHASRLGQIRNRRGRILKQSKSRKGYVYVHLGDHTMGVAGLVLRAWTGEPFEDGYYAQWRDGDRSNNWLYNLMWAGPRGKKW